MKFVARQKVVEAEQFRLGRALPAGVVRMNLCGREDCSTCGKCYLAGTDVEVRSGDWVIRDGETFRVVKDVDFRREYDSPLGAKLREISGQMMKAFEVGGEPEVVFDSQYFDVHAAQRFEAPAEAYSGRTGKRGPIQDEAAGSTEALDEAAKRLGIVAPDLRTFEGAKSFMNRRGSCLKLHVAFNVLLAAVWSEIPEGPGKTVFVRALKRARADALSAIGNCGQ